MIRATLGPCRAASRASTRPGQPTTNAPPRHTRTITFHIIGDIHGHADKLKALLRKLGYEQRQGAWRHPAASALFVGDFIDRGPCQLETLDIVRRMVDAGSARAVMGNHEFNAIAWHTPDPDTAGAYLRPRHGTKARKTAASTRPS